LIDVDLDALTPTELVQLAQEVGIVDPSLLTQDELLLELERKAL